jgi:2-haloacid dehalogenase
MARIIVFDVNETLLNVRHLEPLFEEAFGDRAALREWFSLLLQHSEVATLADPYFDFATLARAALQMTASSRGSFFPSTAQSKYSKEWPRCPRIPRFLTRINRYGMADFDW